MKYHLLYALHNVLKQNDNENSSKTFSFFAMFLIAAKQSQLFPLI